MATPPSVAESQADASNNIVSRTSNQSSTNVCFDLEVLKNYRNRCSTNGQSEGLLYKSVSVSEKRVLKVQNVKLQSREEGQRIADSFSDNVKLMLEKSSKRGDKLNLAKTLAIDGCILIIVDLTPIKSLDIAKDAIQMVDCLPRELQQEEVYIICPKYRACFKNGKLAEIYKNEIPRTRSTGCICCTFHDEECQGTSREIALSNSVRTKTPSSPSLASVEIPPAPQEKTTTVKAFDAEHWIEKSPEVTLIDPPCLVEGTEQNVKIYTKAICTRSMTRTTEADALCEVEDEEENTLRIVTAIGSKVVRDDTMTTSTSQYVHHLHLSASENEGDLNPYQKSPHYYIRSGSVRTIQNDAQNRPVVSDLAPFMILPSKQANEINDLFEEKVKTARTEVRSKSISLPASTTNTACCLTGPNQDRSYVWLKILKPLLKDMDFLLSQDPKELRTKVSKSQSTRDFYFSIVHSTLSFFKEERMWTCLEFFETRIAGWCYSRDNVYHPLIDATLWSSLNVDCEFRTKNLHGRMATSMSLEDYKTIQKQNQLHPCVGNDCLYPKNVNTSTLDYKHTVGLVLSIY